MGGLSPPFCYAPGPAIGGLIHPVTIEKDYKPPDKDWEPVGKETVVTGSPAERRDIIYFLFLSYRHINEVVF